MIPLSHNKKKDDPQILKKGRKDRKKNKTELYSIL